MKYKYIITYLNGVTEVFEGENRNELAKSIESSKNNICNKCGYRFITSDIVMKKIGKVNPIVQNINGTKTYTINQINCRECEAKKAAALGRKIYNQNLPNHARKARSNNMLKLNNDYESQAYIKAARALKQFKDFNELYIYYASIWNDDSVFKIGISSDPSSRFQRSSASNQYKDIKIIKSGLPKDIIELERQIKIKFCLRNFELGSEYFNKSDLENVLKICNV